MFIHLEHDNHICNHVHIVIICEIWMYRTHRIHVVYIYIYIHLHLVNLYGTCGWIYHTWIHGAGIAICDLNLTRYGSGGIGGRSGGPGAGAGGFPMQHSKQNRRNPCFAMMPSAAVLFGIPEVLNKSSNCKSSEQKNSRSGSVASSRSYPSFCFKNIFFFKRKGLQHL